ncbi:hypothetical protein [Pseudomonas syringae group genomosp. 3]|uniref:hypothetical protein n=1 Tax=Pseudomonas syringae group genomosp. 3 TaxID=251701 RepID=UPI0019052535|nr:hypothetical protein [Pseudomonas syringae group genomosp. 3]QQN29330.1 hypothetical protein JHZ65_10320 [Pseudomonas syringae pv. maculicola]
MNTEEMQNYVLDEFLEWMIDECDARGESYTLCTERDGFGRFLYVWVQTSWVAWQASRETLVIELPQQSGANLDWNQAIRYCHQAIEAAGVKVKP